jgi:hypothetical protein
LHDLTRHFFFAETFCVNADAATRLTSFGVLGFAKSLPAVDATRADVVSLEDFFVAMIGSFNCVNQKNRGLTINPR